ncbi:MAG TPA: hypothetical protein VHE81_21350 [Lacipirellulaceae bacterium]|nr:hypothetical protein [Lacipirellulaceae bacterium]
MSTNAATLTEQGFGTTERRDAWWLQPLAMAAAFIVFIIYATFRGLYNGDYEYGHRALSNSLYPDSAYFLSPFYSPLLVLPKSMAWICPAIFVMWMPAGFRVTCYYGRRAYYRALFADPPACAVAEICKKNYKGERGAWIFQNIHRYFLYLALLLVCMHIGHVVEACRWPTASGMTFGMSVGTLVLAVDLVFLALYVFSCHSLRHLIGGGLDCFSGSSGQTRYKLWSGCTSLNKYHGLFFWISLFTVGFADFYVWMVSSGRWVDHVLFVMR